MLHRLRNAFYNWNDLLSSCYKCGAETESYGHEYLDGHTLCEYGIRCKICKANIAYWAYGGYDGPTTRTDLVRYWYLNFKYIIKERIRNFP